MNLSVDEVKQKWLSLRAQFGRELKNSNKQKSGQSTDELYISQWVFYDKMKFLQHVMKTKKSRDSLDLTFDSDSPNTSVQDDEEQDDQDVQDTIFTKREKAIRKKTKLEDTKQKLLSTCIDVLKTSSDSSVNKVEVCHFSMHVAEKLKAFSKFQRMVAEKRINDILFELEMEEDTSAATTSIPTTHPPLYPTRGLPLHKRTAPI